MGKKTRCSPLIKSLLTIRHPRKPLSTRVGRKGKKLIGGEKKKKRTAQREKLFGICMCPFENPRQEVLGYRGRAKGKVQRGGKGREGLVGGRGVGGRVEENLSQTPQLGIYILSTTSKGGTKN